MRYLDRRDTPNVDREDSASLLLQQFGPYCAFCEDYLPEDFRVWNKITGEDVKGEISPEEWNELLPICPSCFLAQARSGQRPFVSPDEDRALFPWNADGTIRYRLAKVRFELFDDDHRPNASFDEEIVVVEGDTDLVNSTIAKFQLNSEYYVAGKMLMPETAFNSMFDCRVERRTHAWRIATRSCDQMFRLGLFTGQDEANDALTDSVMTTVRNSFASTGFWSTWLSAFRTVGQNYDINERRMNEVGREILTPLTGQKI